MCPFARRFVMIPGRFAPLSGEKLRTSATVSFTPWVNNGYTLLLSTSFRPCCAANDVGAWVGCGCDAKRTMKTSCAKKICVKKMTMSAVH